MYPKGEADGKPVNILVPVYTAMEGQRSVRPATRRNWWLKCEDVDLVGKSANELMYDSIGVCLQTLNNGPKQAFEKSF